VQRLDPHWPALLGWLQRCHTRLHAAAAGERGPSHYTLLGVPCDCAEAQLRHAWRRASLRLHPDRATAQGGEASSTAAFQAMQRAYDCLRDPAKRAEYDFGPARDWEAAARARHFPPREFRPFARRPPRQPSQWDPCE